MSKQSNKKRRRKKRKFRLILVTIVMIYLLFRLVPGLTMSVTRTYTVEMDVIQNTETVKGIKICDEKVYKSKTQGEIEFYKKEGEKVGIGDKIAHISKNEKSIDLNKKLKDLDNKIKAIEEDSKTSKMFDNDLRKIEDKIDNILYHIQTAVLNSQYNKVKDYKDQLKILVNKRSTILGEDKYTKLNLNKLKKERKKIVDKLEKLNKSYYSKNTGILSYNIDGLEKIYTLNSMAEINTESFRIIDTQTVNTSSLSTTNYGQAIFKICDNYKWYIVVKVSDKSINYFDKGKNVYIRINNNEEEIKAKVLNINNNADYSVCIFELNTDFYKYYDKRYLDVCIILENNEGLKIPKEAIKSKGNLKGVYTKDLNNIIKFVPIKIIASSKEYVLVKDGSIELNIDGEVIKKKSLSMYDEVILNPSKIEKIQVLNDDVNS